MQRTDELLCGSRRQGYSSQLFSALSRSTHSSGCTPSILMDSDDSVQLGAVRRQCISTHRPWASDRPCRVDGFLEAGRHKQEESVSYFARSGHDEAHHLRVGSARLFRFPRFLGTLRSNLARTWVDDAQCYPQSECAFLIMLVSVLEIIFLLPTIQCGSQNRKKSSRTLLEHWPTTTSIQRIAGFWQYVKICCNLERQTSQLLHLYQNISRVLNMLTNCKEVEEKHKRMWRV